MRKHRTINGLLRMALAVVFGFMSLLHGPVMTFAMAAPAHHDMPRSHSAHHHQGARPQDDPQPIERGTIPVCYALGCFVAVESLPAGTPGAPLELMGTLAPGIGD